MKNIGWTLKVYNKTGLYSDEGFYRIQQNDNNYFKPVSITILVVLSVGYFSNSYFQFVHSELFLRFKQKLFLGAIRDLIDDQYMISLYIHEKCYFNKIIESYANRFDSNWRFTPTAST